MKQKTLFIILLTIILSAGAAWLVSDSVVKHRLSAVAPATGERTVRQNDTRRVISATGVASFSDAAETAVQTVVYVKVVKRAKASRPSSLFDMLFGFAEIPQEQVGLGSGVIIRPDGYIVTNNHVVNGATEVQVMLNNNKTYEAKVIGTDEATDVALIKIDAEGLPTIPFADSDNLRLGEWVLAIGSPYNLRSTITAGIVSAKGRSMGGATEQMQPGQQPKMKIESFIQTDAVVNPGNSGGALVNKAGELVGINTMIYSQTGSYAGYSFAVPSNIVRKIVEDLIDFGSVKRARLGVTYRQVTEDDQKDLKLSSLEGVYIEEVSAGSTADKAGVKKGDILLSIDGAKVSNMAFVQEKVNGYRPGDKAVLSIIRDGRERQIEVVFQGTVEETGTVDEDGSVAFYGSKLRKAPKETLERLGLKNGVEIVSVGDGKLLDAGASEGFVILYVNDQAVSKPEDVIEIAKKSRRAVYIEGVTSYGKASYFGFGKE